jgi:dipeptidyl aminopeptidase/acylaminoacyl peptidase
MVANHFSVFGEADLTFDVEYFYVGGTPWADPAKYIRMSPIGHVMNAKTPTLLLHGMDDIRCPFPQSMEFYRGLQAAGVETELVAYPREPHVFREPAHQLDKMRRELEWMERHVLGNGR